MNYVKYLRLPKLAYLYVYVMGTLKVISWERVSLQTELDSTQSHYLYCVNNKMRESQSWNVY